MEKRKSISKKIRFEIFKRDGFRCGYCGQSPPVVILEIDHIEPKSKGGKDDINNYITACFDCNRGKRDIPLDKIPSTLSENIEQLKEKEKQISEYRKFIKSIEKRTNKDIKEIEKVFQDSFYERSFTDTFINGTIRKFLDSLPLHEVIDAMRIATSKQSNPDSCVKYFCGICWNKIKGVSTDKLIVREWVNLSRKYGRGVGYYKREDIQGISHLWGDGLVKLMHATLKEKRAAYWKHFMCLVNGDENAS